MRKPAAMVKSKIEPDAPKMDRRARDLRYPVDAYFSADVETDGPIPGPFSMLSFALVYAGAFDGKHFAPPQDYKRTFYRELKPISENFQPEALRVNGLDRDRLLREGKDPKSAMTEASHWIRDIAGAG